MPRFRFIITIGTAVAISLGGCGSELGFDFPVSDAARSRDYPRLVPLDAFEAAAPNLAAAGDDLDARAAALRARAKALSTPVLSPEERERLGG